jgi:hypothetical protein
MTTSINTTAIAAALSGLALVTPTAFAAVAHATPKPVAAATFASGGVGMGDQARMQKLAPSYRLHMIFARRPDGAYLARVPVTIRDQRGNTVFKLSNSGPLLYVNLPNGDYKITATVNGITQTKSIGLHARGARDVDFYWPKDSA